MERANEDLGDGRGVAGHPEVGHRAGEQDEGQVGVLLHIGPEIDIISSSVVMLVHMLYIPLS